MNDEEWQAYINEYNAVMDDVEGDLHAALEGNRLSLEGLAGRGEVPALEARAVIDTLREGLLRVQGRWNASGRRLLRMREVGEFLSGTTFRRKPIYEPSHRRQTGDGARDRPGADP